MKSMKQIIIFCLVVLGACKQPSPGLEKRSAVKEVMAAGKWIDLTYSFSAETIYLPNNPTGFKLDTQFNGTTAAGFYYSSNAYSSPEHGGTHLDAPVHFAKGKWSVDQVPLSQLTGEAVVIDVSEKANNDPDYQAVPADVEAWEKVNGVIPEDAIVLF